MPSHRAFDVRVFLRGTEVFLPLPLPHGFQVIWVEEGDPPACWHLLHPNNPPEGAGRTDIVSQVETHRQNEFSFLSLI